MTINVKAKGIEMTPSIHEFSEEKAQSLDKYADNIKHVDVEVGKQSDNNHLGDVFFCKMIVDVNGHVIVVERESDDLYKAIDKVRDHLRVEITDWKEKQRG